MKSFALIILVFFSFTNISANTIGRKFDSKDWKKLIQYTYEHGELDHFSRGAILTLSYRNFSPSGRSVRRNFFSLIGYMNSNNRFIARHASLVSERWRLNQDDNWEVDLWGFEANLKGRLHNLNHRFILETQSGRVLDYKTYPTRDADHPEVLRFWREKVQFWLRWTD